MGTWLSVALLSACCALVPLAVVVDARPSFAAAPPPGTIGNSGLGMSGPHQIVSGPDGNLWFTNTQNNSIGRITPAGVVSNFTGIGISVPMGITVGPDGNLWFTNYGNSSIGRITPAGVVSRFTNLSIKDPIGIAPGPDGNLWFTNFGSSSIGRITPAGVVSKFVGPGIGGPQGIAAGPDGNLWFANNGNDSIGRITPAGVVSSFTGPGVKGPAHLTAGPDGNVWFTNDGNSSIGRITPTGVVSNFTDSTISNPLGISTGVDGRLWFGNAGNRSLGQITTEGIVSSSADEASWNPHFPVAGPDGNMWFTNYSDSSIGRVTPEGVWTRFTGTGVVRPFGITAGPDGNLWFTSSGGRSIGRITPQGISSSIGDPGIAMPVGISTGPDGNLWFTDTTAIGKVTPEGVVSLYTHPGLSSPLGITAGSDGNLWFTNNTSSFIGRISPQGAIALYGGAGSGVSGPHSIALGPDGNLWFTNSNGSSIGRITPAGLISTFSGPGISVPTGIARGPDGNLWFTNAGNSSIGRITPAGVVSNFTGIGLSAPRSITTGADGRLWFTNVGNNSIGAITVAGVVSQYKGTGIDEPTGIVAGPDGNLWFTNQNNSSIGWATTGFPTAPGTPTAVAGNRQATVSWTPPTADGDSPITTYTVRAVEDPGRTCTWTSGPLECTVTGLDAGSPYSFTVTATTAVGTSLPSATSAAVVPWSGGAFHPVTPFRVWDSRTGPGPVGPVAGGASADVPIAGAGPVPSTATAVVLNVTVTGGTQASYVTAYPAGSATPTAANVVFAPGQTVPNLVTVGTGSSGGVSFFNQLGTVDIVVDVLGYFDDSTASGELFNATAPTRLLDSRTDTGGWGGVPLGPGQSRDVDVRGSAGVPEVATAVVMNVTVTSGTAASYVQAYPSAVPRPTTANLLFDRNETVSNLVVVGIGANGAVSLYNQQGDVDVVADVVGYFEPTAGGRFHPIVPTRALDSRLADGGAWDGTPLGPNTARSLVVDEIPDTAVGVAGNVTVTKGSSASYLAAAPTPGSVPSTTANLLFGPQQTVPNAVHVGLGAGRSIDIYNQAGSVHVIVDIAGYYAPW